MAENDLSEQVSRLEDKLHALNAQIATCRKLQFAAKLVLAAGFALILSLVLGIIRPDPLAIVTTIAALVGGTVLFGSNASTWSQAETEMQTAQAQLATLIDNADLRLVPDPAPERRVLN